MRVERNDALQQLINRRDNGQIKVVTGLRGCGKTYLLKELYRMRLMESGVQPENIIFVGLDMDANAALRNPVFLDQYLHDRIRKTEGRCYVILDEIQYCISVPNAALPESVRSPENDITFYDIVLGLQDVCDLYIVGSSAYMLGSDVMMDFRGCSDEIKIYPLSFHEFSYAFEGNTQHTWFRSRS